MLTPFARQPDLGHFNTRLVKPLESCRFAEYLGFVDLQRRTDLADLLGSNHPLLSVVEFDGEMHVCTALDEAGVTPFSNNESVGTFASVPGAQRLRLSNDGREIELVKQRTVLLSAIPCRKVPRIA